MSKILAAVFLTLAAAMASAEPLPILYECNADDGVVLEEQFCEDFHAALLRTKNVVITDVNAESYFHITILPAAREGYLGVLITSNYVTPPFKPLELSAFSGIWMVSPATDGVQLADAIAASTLKGTFDWINWAKGKRLKKDDPRTLVCDLGGYNE